MGEKTGNELQVQTQGIKYRKALNIMLYQII